MVGSLCWVSLINMRSYLLMELPRSTVHNSQHSPSSTTSSNLSTQPSTVTKSDSNSAVAKTIAMTGLLTSAIARQTVRLISSLAGGTGQALGHLSNLPGLNNPLVRRLAGVLRLDWLLGMAGQVDVEKVQATVTELQQRYPQESQSQIVHRLIVHKALNAGRIGFMSSLIPGVAVALLAIDLAATTLLQTELVYEIAAAYGLNLRDPARKGEVLAIFGLALGGSNAVKAGLGFLRNVPLAGTLIAASTNATVLYAVGRAASSFYEAQLQDGNTQPASEAILQIRQDSEQYLQRAIAQQAILDQFLAHMIVASFPDKTWADILPELKALILEPNSLQTIETNLKAPLPLSELVENLDCDFAVPLYSQCQHLAQRNQTVSEEQQQVLDAITRKCDPEMVGAIVY